MINYDKQNRRLAKLEKQRDEARERYRYAETERAWLYELLDSIMHEVRRLNSEVSDSCEKISKSIDAEQYQVASQEANDAFYTCGLLSSRLTFADYELNSDVIALQQKYSAGVYKKFDKARRILYRSAKERQIDIQLEGPSHNEIDVLPAFEMVPFVLLDNAVKYSPRNQDISVTISDDPTPECRILVEISSIGPTAKGDQVHSLLERGVRGEGAEKSGVAGQGIGLYLASTLTKLANGVLSVSSDPDSLYSIDGVDYSEFNVTIRFARTRR